MPSFGPISGGGNSVASPVYTSIACTGAASRMMNQRIATKRRTDTQSTATAGLVPSYADHIAGVCAALQVDSGSESAVDMREAGELRLRMYCPSRADIKTTDLVYPQEPSIYAGMSFSVESPVADDAGHEAYGKWRIRRVEGDSTR